MIHLNTIEPLTLNGIELEINCLFSSMPKSKTSYNHEVIGGLAKIEVVGYLGYIYINYLYTMYMYNT